MRQGSSGRGVLVGFVVSVLVLSVSTCTTLVGMWSPPGGSSLRGAWVDAPPTRKLLTHDDPRSKHRKRVVEPVTVVTFFLNADADSKETVLVDHYQDVDDAAEVAPVVGRSSASHRRLEINGTSDAVSSEAERDDQASKLTRLLVPLVCVAIACLVAASAILLFVVIVRTRNGNPKVESTLTVHHIPPVDEPSYPPPQLPYGDIPINETLTTANEVSAGTASAGAHFSTGSYCKPSGFGVGLGNRLLEAIKRRTRSIATAQPFAPSAPSNTNVLPQEVHRPNLLTGISRQPSSVAQADLVASVAPRFPHDAVPLSVVSTMTNSFNNENDDDDDILDMDLDLYLGLVAAASSSSSRREKRMESGLRSPSNPTDALSAIEEGDSSSRQLVQEIHWQGSSSDVMAGAATDAAADSRHPQQSGPGRTETPKPKPSQHFVDALYSLVAAGVPPQVIIASSFDSTGSGPRGEPTRSSATDRVVVNATTAATGHGSSHVSVQELRRKHSRGALDSRSARRSGVGPNATLPTASAAAEPSSCLGPRGYRIHAQATGPVQLEEGRDDAEDSHAGSSGADGRNDSLLEL